MKIVVQRPFKPFGDIDHLLEACCFQSLAGEDRAGAAATDQQDRTTHIPFDQAADLAGKLGINLPVRHFLPGHMLGTDRMADVHVLDFRPAIDEYGLRRLLEEIMGGLWIEMQHGVREVGMNRYYASKAAKRLNPSAQQWSPDETARLDRRNTGRLVAGL